MNDGCISIKALSKTVCFLSNDYKDSEQLEWRQKAAFLRNLNDFDVLHRRVVGPSKEAAQLEGSKSFLKVFIYLFSIPQWDGANAAPLSDRHPEQYV